MQRAREGTGGGKEIYIIILGKGAGIEITPYAAGHTIGGTVWKIVKETEEIVYHTKRVTRR